MIVTWPDQFSPWLLCNIEWAKLVDGEKPFRRAKRGEDARNCRKLFFVFRIRARQHTLCFSPAISRFLQNRPNVLLCDPNASLAKYPL